MRLAPHSLPFLLPAVLTVGCALEPPVGNIADTASGGEPPGDTTTSSTHAPGGSTSSPATPTGHATTGESGEANDAGDDSTSETTASTPICGDGVVEGDETCDDMNDIPDDGCSACARDSIVFVTSELYRGNVDGLAGADQRCRMLAAIAGLPRFETYRAWLSSSKISAGQRLLHSPGRYVLVNGLVVAQDWNALVSGQIENPINVDEYSQTQVSGAWTSTVHDGTAAPGAHFCNDWTASSGPQGGVGLVNNTDATWSYLEPVDCELDLHLYCIEQ